MIKQINKKGDKLQLTNKNNINKYCNNKVSEI